MKIQRRRTILAVVMSLIIIGSCSGDKSEQDSGGYVPSTQPVPTQSGFYGWQPVTLQNAFVRLDVVPELGGKIMGYSLVGSQLLWHNPAHEGEIDIFAQADKGEPFINAGGAKVWPEPRSAWGGPPDNVLDGARYEVSSDDSTITVTSPPDTAPGRTGIEYSHTYTLRPRKTTIGLELSMMNRSDSTKDWAMRHLVTLPADTSVTITVPAASNTDWHILSGDSESSQWLGVEDGLFHARYDGSTGSVGIKPDKGWVAWHDAKRNIAYVIQFPRENLSSALNGGYQVEVSVTSGMADETVPAYYELSVLGPLTNLAPGERSAMDITWNVCRCTGVKQVSSVGVIAEEPRFHIGPNIITGRMSVFTAGTLIEFFYDEAGEQTARERIMEVTPLTEIVLRREIYVPVRTVGIRYELWGPNETYLGELANITLPAEARR